MSVGRGGAQPPLPVGKILPGHAVPAPRGRRVRGKRARAEHVHREPLPQRQVQRRTHAILRRPTGPAANHRVRHARVGELSALSTAPRTKMAARRGKGGGGLQVLDAHRRHVPKDGSG